MKESSKAIEPSKKLWRTLIRIVRVVKPKAFICIPAWDSKQIVVINLDSLPPHIRAVLKEGYRLRAKVNIGAARKGDLFFTDWELDT